MFWIPCCWYCLFYFLVHALKLPTRCSLLIIWPLPVFSSWFLITLWFHLPACLLKNKQKKNTNCICICLCMPDMTSVPSLTFFAQVLQWGRLSLSAATRRLSGSASAWRSSDLSLRRRTSLGSPCSWVWGCTWSASVSWTPHYLFPLSRCEHCRPGYGGRGWELSISKISHKNPHTFT